MQELLASNEQMALLSDQVQLAFQKAEAERVTLERLILRTPGLFCILKGPEHCFELINTAYQNLYPGRELLYKTVAEALPVIVEQGFLEVLDTVYQTGQDFLAEEISFKIGYSISPDREPIYFNFTYQAIYNEAEIVTGILAFGYDVTPLVLYKQKLKELGYEANPVSPENKV